MAAGEVTGSPDGAKLCDFILAVVFLQERHFVLGTSFPSVRTLLSSGVKPCGGIRVLPRCFCPADLDLEPMWAGPALGPAAPVLQMLPEPGLWARSLHRSPTPAPRTHSQPAASCSVH